MDGLNQKKEHFKFEETGDYSTVRSKAYINGADKDGDEYPLIYSYTLSPGTAHQMNEGKSTGFDQYLVDKVFPFLKNVGANSSDLFKTKLVGNYLNKIHSVTAKESSKLDDDVLSWVSTDEEETREDLEMDQALLSLKGSDFKIDID